MAQLKKVADLKDKEEVDIAVTVVRIFDPKKFTKKDGSDGQVRNVKVKDETGECRIALWDNDVEMIETLEIVEGSELKCQDCYVRTTDFGTDITKGRKGIITKV